MRECLKKVRLLERKRVRKVGWMKFALIKMSGVALRMKGMTVFFREVFWCDNKESE